MPDEPTLGEVLRRLDVYTAQQERILDRLERLPSENAKTFVRQDVYLAQRASDQAVVADLHGDMATVRDDRKRDLAELRGEIDAVKEDRKRDIDWRRQMHLFLVGLAITNLVAIALAVLTIVMKK